MRNKKKKINMSRNEKKDEEKKSFHEGRKVAWMSGVFGNNERQEILCSQEKQNW